MKKAILIIDMQKGSFLPEYKRFDVPNITNRINQLTQRFRDQNLPVIFIQHDGSRFNVFKPDTKDWEIISGLVTDDSDIFMNKYANDIFYETNLMAELHQLNVNELVITGCATEFCVEATIQSALSKDFIVTVVADAHTTSDRSHLEAKKVIEHYNWVWQNMIPTKGIVTVKPFKEIIAEQ